MHDGRNPDSALVERLRATLHAGWPLRLAVLFGSAADGSARPDSDIDVGILPQGAGLDTETEAALVAALSIAGRADVDIIHLEDASTLLRWQVATTGVPLMEASPGDFVRFRARAAAEYIDFAPALAYHGEIFRRRLIEQGKPR
jgi:predicted nucleotidyltransferase